MGFRKDSYATVWSVEAKTPSVTKVRISISKKNKQTGEYEQDFSGFVNFCGTAASNALKLREKDRIKLGDVDVTTWYNKEKKIEYTNYTTNAYATTTTYKSVENTTAEQTTWQSQMTYLGEFTGTYYKGSTHPCNGGSGRMLVSCYEKPESFKGSVASRFVYNNYGYYVNDKTIIYVEFEKYPQLNGWYSVDDCNTDQNIVDFYFADYSTCPWQTAGVTTVSIWICA